MNEKIKQLCEQAKAYATESTKDFTGDEPVVWMDYYTEKFAELIVEKCAGIIESQDVDPSFKLRMSWAVKKHFGVK